MKAIHCLRALAASALMIFGTTEAPAYVYCSGPVYSVTIDSNGMLQANWGYADIYLCALNADTASPTTVVSAATCQSIYTTLLSAYYTGKPFASHFSTSTTCSAAFGSGPWPAEQPYAFTTQ